MTKTESLPPADWLADYNARMNARAAEEWRDSYSPPPRIDPVPNVNSMIISKYWNVAALHEGPKVLTIRAVAFEPGRGPRDDGKWLMYFVEDTKALNLKTQVLRYLEQTISPDSERWIGRRVQLYVDPAVMMAGQVVGGVRVRVGRSAAPPGADVVPRFDPMTGKPLTAAVAAPAPRFDPNTGKPLNVDTATGEFVDTGAAAPAAAGLDEFDDDIPF